MEITLLIGIMKFTDEDSMAVTSEKTIVKCYVAEFIYIWDIFLCVRAGLPIIY